MLHSLFSSGPSLSGNPDYESGDEEPFAYEGVGFQDAHAASDGHYSPANYGGHPSARFQSKHSTTPYGSVEINTANLAVHCSKDGFLIVFRAGRLGDLYVKGTCQVHHTTTCLPILTRLTRPPFPFSDPMSGNDLSVIQLQLSDCRYQVNYALNTVTIAYTGCYVTARVDCNVSGQV